MWVVPTVSILVTFFYAATSGPAEIYSSSTDSYVATIVIVAIIFIVAFIFIWKLISFIPFLLALIKIIPDPSLLANIISVSPFLLPLSPYKMCGTAGFWIPVNIQY